MPTDQDRLDVAARYINAAQAIASTTAVPMVTAYWQHFFQTGCIVKPGPSTEDINLTMLSQAGHAQPRLLIIPLFPEDQDLGPPVESLWNYCENSSAAVYMSLSNLIFFRATSAETPFSLGCTFLHELGHAYQAFHEGSAWARRRTWSARSQSG